MKVASEVCLGFILFQLSSLSMIRRTYCACLPYCHEAYGGISKIGQINLQPKLRVYIHVSLYHFYPGPTTINQTYSCSRRHQSRIIPCFHIHLGYMHNRIRVTRFGCHCITTVLTNWPANLLGA